MGSITLLFDPSVPEPFVDRLDDVLGPLFFFGVPAALALGYLAVQWRRGHRVPRPVLAGAIALIVSYPLRMWLAGTDVWLGFATWMTRVV